MTQKIIEKQLKAILDFIDIDPDVIIEADGDAYRIYISGNNLNFLIGYRGESLDALQYLLSQAVFREVETWVPISVDINDYKAGKLEKVSEMIKSFVDRVRFHQKEMKLPPLTPYERKHVHMLIADYVDIDSESRGEGKNRRLFLKPKK